MKRIHPFIFLLAISFAGFAQTGTTYSVSITSGGNTRTYTYYVPTMYNNLTDTVPLIINIHGYTGSSNLQEVAHDFRKIADTANFIILQPQAKGNPGFENFNNNPTSWDVWNTVSSGAEDRNFIMQALDSMEANFNIDTNRVYVTGFSQGGYMSYILSTIHSNRITAMASVAGVMSTEYYNTCYPVHPLPIMHIHGTNDALVAYNGNTNALPAETVIGHWIQFNQCDSVPEVNAFLPDIADSATVDQSKVVHYVFSGGCKGVKVEFYKILNGGHQVPSAENPPATQYGIGTQNKDFTAAREAWRFFRQYRLDSLYNGTPEAVCVPLSNPPPAPYTIPPPPFVATDIDAFFSTTDIVIYPNPSDGKFSIVTNNSGNLNIKIIDLLGNVVLSENINGRQSQYDLIIASGIYLYIVDKDSETIKTGKLIVR